MKKMTTLISIFLTPCFSLGVFPLVNTCLAGTVSGRAFPVNNGRSFSVQKDN